MKEHAYECVNMRDSSVDMQWSEKKCLRVICMCDKRA